MLGNMEVKWSEQEKWYKFFVTENSAKEELHILVVGFKDLVSKF